MYHAGTTDEDLLRGCRAGERRAQRALYERYFGRNMAVCMRYTGNREEALEILNMAFLKVFQHVDRYEPSGSLGGWIARIVFNTTMDHLRSQRSYRQTIHFPEYQEAVQIETVHDRLAAEDVLRLIQALPDTQRQVFSLNVVDGYRHRDIAEMLGFDEATSRWHLAQARKNLKAMLAGVTITTTKES